MALISLTSACFAKCKFFCSYSLIPQYGATLLAVQQHGKAKTQIVKSTSLWINGLTTVVRDVC